VFVDSWCTKFAGNGNPIPYDRLPAAAMIGWHVARHWAAGDGGGAPLFYQHDIDVLSD